MRAFMRDADVSGRRNLSEDDNFCLHKRTTKYVTARTPDGAMNRSCGRSNLDSRERGS